MVECDFEAWHRKRFHIIPGLWFDNYGIEISESIRVTETGCEVLADFPRELIVNEGRNIQV